MLFRPSADQRLDGILAMLEVWNDEADRFRAVAVAARNGAAASSLVVAGVEEAHDGLISLLDEIDRALDGVPAGDRAFADLLKAPNALVQSTALPEEANEEGIFHLPRLIGVLKRGEFGRWRQLIDAINQAQLVPMKL